MQIHVRAIGRHVALVIAFAGAAHAQETRARATPVRPLPYDSATVRAVLLEGVAAAGRSPASERTPLLGALGRAQIDANDYTGATRTLALLGEGPLALPTPEESETPAATRYAAFARRLTCALRDAGRPGDALAVVRGMSPGDDRDWELAHAVSLQASGGPAWRPAAASPALGPLQRWRTALDLAGEIHLAAARLDALLALAQSVPDTGAGRPTLERAYVDARRIVLADTDRQRSRDAMLAEVAVRLGDAGEARALFARLTDVMDLRYVVSAAAAWPQARPLVRELAPRTMRAGRAIRDSAAREVYLISLWQTLQKAGGRVLADSLLPDVTALAERPDDLSEAMQNAAGTDTSPAASALRAAEHGAFGAARQHLERIPLDDRAARRATVLADIGQSIYGGNSDSARAYLRAARAALLAAPRDSATLDEVALRIADAQLWIGDDDEGVRTLDLVRDAEGATYVVDRWGTSTFSRLTARAARGYADRLHRPAMRDLVLSHVVNPYLTTQKASDADAAWGRALADSIATPAFRRAAQRAVANAALVRRDSADARRRTLDLLRDRSIPWQRPTEVASRSVVGDLVRAGGWREAITWARSARVAAERARRLLAVAASAQQELDRRSNKPMFISNGPDWCRDGF